MTNEISKIFYKSVADLCKTSTEPMIGNLPGMTLYEWLQEGDSDVLSTTPETLAKEWDEVSKEN